MIEAKVAVVAALGAALAASSTVLPTLQLILTVIALPLSIYAAVTAHRALEAVAPRITEAATEGAELLEQLGDAGPDA